MSTQIYAQFKKCHLVYECVKQQVLTIAQVFIRFCLRITTIYCCLCLSWTQT